MNTLPAWEDAEVTLLRACLRDESLVDVVHLDPEEFSRVSHRVIWMACQALRGEGKAITIKTVQVFCKGKLGDDSRLPALYEMLDHWYADAHKFQVSPAEAVAHAAVVSTYAKVRQAKAELEALLPMAAGNDERVLDEMPKAVERVVGGRAMGGEESPWRVLLSKQIDDIENRRHGGKKVSLPTGLAHLDKLGLFAPDRLIVVGARPGVGKSALALSITCHASDQGARVLFVSLEMSREELTERIIAREARVPLVNITQGDVDDLYWTAILPAHERMDAWPLIITRPHGKDATWQGIQARVKQENAKGKLDLIVVDYLQLIEVPAGRRDGTREEEVSALSRSLKMLAGEVGCPVLALSQLNRTADEESGARPAMKSLRESGGTENNADVVVLLSPVLDGGTFDEWSHRHERHVLCDVRKNRSGPTTDFVLTYEGAYTSFTDEP